MLEFLEKLDDIKVLVVGDVMLDQYLWGSVSRISPEAPVPVVSLDKKTVVVGGSANVAANIAGLGAKPYLLGIIGEDPEAKSFKKTLEETGVSPEYLISDPTRQTTVKTRIVANSQHVARVDRENSDLISAELEEKLWSKIENVIDEINVVVVSDYAKGVITEKMAARLITCSRKKDKKILVDPKGIDYSKYKGATLITPNQKEALEASSTAYYDERSVEKAGKKLLDDLELENLLITRGEKGMLLFFNDRSTKTIIANARKVFDVTGAGDTVIAALAASIGAGSDFLSACKLANIAAGFVVEKVGTRPVSKEELIEYLNNN